MGISFIEQFLGKYFMKMPEAVRIIIYFILLVVAIYLTLLPKFINGEIRLDMGNEEYRPYTLGRVSMIIDGREIATYVDSQGKWSLPLVDKIPTNQTLTFWYQDQNRKERGCELQLGGFDIMRGKHLVVFHDPDKIPRFHMKEEQRNAADKHGTGLSLSPFGILSNLVFAADINMEPASGSTTGMVENRTVQITKEIIQNNSESIDSTAQLYKDLHLSTRQEVILKERLEKEFKITIPAQEWQNSVTLGDLVDLVKLHQRLSPEPGPDNSGYAYYGHLNYDEGWKVRHFMNASKQADAGPERGDMVEAINNVNARAGYIEFKLIGGWTNQKKIGLIQPGDRLLVEEVRNIGSHIWIKYRRLN